jgi:ATP-dependent protease HslVU (ClpYQ) peptidase subunit
MTTIAAVQGDGWAVVGSDSRITDEGRVYAMPKGSGKVVHNEDYMFGTAGDLRAVNIMEHAFTPPDASGYSGKDLDAFITTRFIPALRKCFEEHGYSASPEEKDTKEAAIGHESQILAVVNGSIYELGEDYSWLKDASGLYAMGSGGDYAIGALHAMAPPKAKLTIELAKDIVKEALTIAAKLDSNSGGPFTILVQES